MASPNSPNHHADHYPDPDIIEAFADFQSLQTLTASLIFRILHTRCELEERFQAEDDPSVEDEMRLRHADEALSALQRIKSDTDALITNFHRPTKTFFEANIDQSRLIARLSALLPSLQPFLPAVSPSEPVWTGYVHDIDKVEFGKEDSMSSEEQLEAAERERDWAREGEAACFDRGPRSQSRLVLPSYQRLAEREFRWAAPMSL